MKTESIISLSVMCAFIVCILYEAYKRNKDSDNDDNFPSSGSFA